MCEPVAHDDRKRHGRSLVTPRGLVPVVLDGTVETAHSIPPPRLGEIATYSISFSEAGEHTDPGGPAQTTITARVEPLRGPYRNTGHDGTPFEQPDRWSSYLHAEGWPATVQGWPALPFGATESGRLVELDLDDVPDGRTGGVCR